MMDPNANTDAVISRSVIPSQVTVTDEMVCSGCDGYCQMVVPAGVYVYSEICGSRASSCGAPAVPVHVYSWLLARLYRTWETCPAGAAAAFAMGRTPFLATAQVRRSVIIPVVIAVAPFGTVTLARMRLDAGTAGGDVVPVTYSITATAPATART